MAAYIIHLKMFLNTLGAIQYLFIFYNYVPFSYMYRWKQVKKCAVTTNNSCTVKEIQELNANIADLSSRNKELLDQLTKVQGEFDEYVHFSTNII